jgi:NADPH:quinone reductase-like Zn-dependent oxidoreductase
MKTSSLPGLSGVVRLAADNSKATSGARMADQLLDYTDKVVLITGGATGIGRATAQIIHDAPLLAVM